MVALAERRAKDAGVAHRATFVRGDLFEADLSKATVITLFLLPDINLRLRPKLLDLKPGTRIASNSFTMGDWEPDAEATLSPCTSWCTRDDRGWCRQRSLARGSSGPDTLQLDAAVPDAHGHARDNAAHGGPCSRARTSPSPWAAGPTPAG